ncbi:MAG: flagellar motor switch protein [Herminiimonas sp.]|nr:flagellar motor switch protein [Herminiimonas sp.]
MPREPHGREPALVQPVTLQAIPDQATGGDTLLKGNLGLIGGVKVRVHAMVGEGEITVAELFGLKDGSVLKLNCPANALVDLQLDGKTVARGQLVVVDDCLGVQITEIDHAAA